jgi:hypothetical protein
MPEKKIGIGNSSGVKTMDSRLPTSKSVRSPKEREFVRRIVKERGLCGLANDTKWDEFISAMRMRTDWRPSYRYKCVGAISGYISAWDVEWFYHLPFPFISVEWMDVGFLQETIEHRLPRRISVTDYSAWLTGLLDQIGLEYTKGENMIRIFGYSPKDLERFDEYFQP